MRGLLARSMQGSLRSCLAGQVHIQRRSLPLSRDVSLNDLARLTPGARTQPAAVMLMHGAHVTSQSCLSSACIASRPDVSSRTAAAGATGADLANMVNEAALLAGRANKGARPACWAFVQKAGPREESAGRACNQAVYASRASPQGIVSGYSSRSVFAWCARMQQGAPGHWEARGDKEVAHTLGSVNFKRLFWHPAHGDLALRAEQCNLQLRHL